jgi:hypothetical protein
MDVAYGVGNQTTSKYRDAVTEEPRRLTVLLG